MKQKVLIIPNDENSLRQISKEVKTFDINLEELIINLSETLEAQSSPQGLGISAPQIGVLKRVFVARIRNRIRGFVNPKIVKLSRSEITILEGCLSVPELYGHVIRPAEIDLEFQDKKGKKTKTHYKAMPARIIQHEIDHLNGTLFIDHAHKQKGKMFKVEIDKKGKEQFIELPYA